MAQIGLRGRPEGSPIARQRTGHRPLSNPPLRLREPGRRSLNRSTRWVHWTLSPRYTGHGDGAAGTIGEPLLADGQQVSHADQCHRFGNSP
jgi:hypothetical protein